VEVAAGQDVEVGKKLFAKCAACHNVNSPTNKLGPHLQGVVGRAAGSVEGYNYSKALKSAGAAGLVWDETNLAEYLANPQGKVPGTKMVFPGLKDPQETQNLIAYLKSVSS
jgi:cytochrome c